jgi:DNA (cytosine-5)-methyltransferase 1
MTHGSLFSGIGGFEYAAQAMGWENVFHCEINPFGQQVLKYHYPKSISYDDITKTDFSIHRGQIDIITGGFPCQPYSQAGNRLGNEDDRHLWPQMLRAIQEIQPRWVVGENVYGIVSWNDGLVFNEVQAEMEAEGYEVQPFILPACAVNAPHRRDRVWFIAHSMRGGHRGRSKTSRPNNTQERKVYQDIRQHGDTIWGEAERCGATTSNSNINGPYKNKIVEKRQQPSNGGKAWSITTPPIEPRDAPNTCDTGLQGRTFNRGIRNSQSERNEQFARCFSPTWQNFPTQSPICGGDDGLPTELHGITFPKWRNESIKAYGNAIVPQVAIQIFKAIEQYEKI